MENIDVSNALKITPSKSEDLIQARIDKIERLSAISRKIAAGTADYIANQAKTAEAKSNSAVGILSNVTGIDFTPEKSIIGTGLNTAVGLGSGLSRLSGYVASGIHDANALLLNKDIPQEVKDARARQLQGQATPEDEKLLALPRGDLTERKVAPNDFMHRVRKDFKSNLSQIQDMEESLKNAQSLREAFDFSSAVHQGTKDALTDDLKHTTVEDLNQVSEGWDALKQGKVIAGLKDMASGIAGSTPKIADAAIKHPLGTAQFLAENLPNTLAAATGAVGMVVSNAAYALDTMGQGMIERTKALKGAMPTNEDLAWNALWSSTAGLAEIYGDKLMGIPKLFKGAPKEVVEAAKDMNKGSFIKSILNSGPVKTTAAIAEGAAGEYVTEGYQTWAENAAKVKETSLEEAFTGAAIGAITGGVMSGGIHGVAELAGSTPEKIKAKEDVVATQVAHGTAILNNDTTAYLDPTTPQYSPTKALEVLYAHAKLDTTTPEVKSTNLNKADDVVAMAEQDLKNVLEASDVAKRSPEQLEAAKGELQQLKSLIESTNPDDKSRLTALNQEISYLERGLQASVSKIAAKQLTAEIKSRTTELNTARTLQEQLTTVVSRKVSPESVSKDIEVAALPLNVADQPAVESSQQAIGRLIKLSMANTQAITHEAATMLANDTANTLTDPQRLYLREFSAARIAQNKLQTTESVGATIMSGDGLNLGLKQYQQYIGRALEAGNTKVASNYIAMLENFVDSHEQKAILATAAMEKAKDTNRSIKILKSKDGRWGYAPAGVEITREMIEKNGGLVLHPNSLRSNALAKAVPVEAEALKQALVAHKAAFALTFNQPVTSVTPAAQTSATPSSAASVPSAVPPSPVPTTKETNVTQTPEAKQSQSQASSTSSGSTTTEAPLPSVADSPKAASVGEAVATGATGVEAVKSTQDSKPAVESATSPLKETVSVEKTAEVESRSEQAPESEEKTAKPIAAGTLSLFSQFKEKLEGTVSEAYKSTNLAAQYLKQSGLVSGATSQRALVAVKDFMSTWRDSTNKRDFLKEHLGMQPDQSFTTNEWAALKNFAVTVSGWLPVIQANLFKYDVLTQEEIKAGKKARNKHGGKSEYKMLDMLQYFYLDDKFADVEENVKTAIAASAYSYVVDRAMSPARMTDEDINTMHGKKEHESIQSYEGMKLLQTMASFEETAITQLGKAAVQALGIKPRDENTPMDILPRLENALGTQALELLKKQGFVKTSEHPLMTINGYWDTSSDEKLIENALKYTNHPGESVSLGSTMSMQNVRDMFKVAKGAKSVGPKQLATQARLRATSPSAFTVASKLYNPLKTLRYVSFVYKKDKEKTYKRELTEQVSVIKEASLGSKSVINKLFGIEKAPRIASTKPANFNQESPKDTNQAMPKLHQKVMQATQQIPHTLVPAMWQVSLGMGKDAILEIAGKVDVNVEDPNFQINNLPSVLAQNDNLENQFDLAFEQITQDGEEASWFVTGSIWSNLRNGYKEMSMNLQSSKIHRYLFTRPAWTVTLKFDDKPMVDEFLISLAMAMGTKTDQKRNEITLEDVFTEQTEDTPAQFHNPDIMEAAYIIQLGLQQGESGEVWTQANIDKVVSVTVGEGMMSLQALTAYANYLTAFDNKLENPDKVKDFSFTLLVGADGKTNGPMLTLLALGAADYQTLNRGGMFSDQEGSTATHFSEYYGEAQARDLYQQLGLDSVTDTMGKMATEEDILNWQADRYERHDTKYRMTAEELREQPFLPEQFQALEAIVGSLQLKAGLVVSALRNLVKKPITAFFFGSSVNNAVKGMENEFIQSIYDHIQGIKQGTKKTDITDLLSNINALIEMSDGPVLTISTLEEAMQLEFTMPQRASLQKSFVVLLGNSVKKKLESTFSTLIARRDVFNKTVQASYEIHAAAVANARINKINELMDQGKLAYRSTTVDGKEVRVPLRDLTKAEYDFVKRSLEHLQPVMHNAFSLEEDYLPAGIYMADSYVDKSTEPMYENAVKFPGNGGPDFKIHSESQLRKEKTPGLRGLPFSIHSSDSFGMQSALAAEPKAEALNVHDEISTGVANIAGSAMAINAATVNTFLHFSPAREALNMLERLVTRMATHVGQDKANPQTVRSMLSNWLDVYNHGLAKEDRIKFDEVADKTLRNAAANAYQVDIDRLTLISKMAYMDQYTWEGGQFKVTQEIRDEAVKQLEALKALKDGYLPSKEAQEAIRYLNTVAHAANKKDAVLPSWFEKTVDEVEEVDLPVKPNTWGVLGSNSLSESSVLSWFDKSDVLSAREVMDALVTEYKKTPKQASSKFALMLLEQLRKVVSPKLVVRMIRPDTAKSDVIGADTGTFDNVLGEYRLDGTEQAIYVMGPEFKNSGVTAELLLHELLHAALSWVLYDVKNGTGTAAAKILYKSLDSLRQRAIERANKTKDLKHFAKILEGESGVDELISWGLSNQEFQTKVLREVTMAIALPSQTQGIVSMNGMQAFLQAIRKFFFRATKVEPVTETGLAVLLANVSGLFAEANTAEQKTARNINLSMAAQINTFSTLDIHEALDTGEVSDAFNDHLRNVLTNIVEKLHGSFGSFKESIMKSVPHSAIDAWALAQANGETPFVSDLQASGFQFNNQTYFVAEQVEATVKSILDSKDGKLSSVREELRKLEAEVRGKLTVQSFYQGPDWATATPQEQAEAQQLYDYLFKKVDDDYLARFAALGLSHEGFNALLKMPTKQAPVILKDRTVGNTLMNLFDRVLVALNGKLTHTKAGQAADVKLAALVRQLVEIENRKKAVLNQVSTGILAFADKKVRASRRGTKNQISKLVNSTMFKRNKNVTIAAVSHVVDAVMGNRVKYLVQNMNKMRNDVFPGAQGAIASALAEMNGNSHDLQKVLREGKAHLEGARKKIISYANKQALESFVDGGVYLADEAKSAVTNVLLRTGAHVLLGKYDMKQIADLVNNKATLLKEIASYEAQLSKFTPAQREIFLYQSKALGYHLAGYGEKSASLMKNASNIANLYTSAYQGQLNEADTLEATKTIDVLTTLYALQYSRSADIAALASVFTTENSRTDGDNNGLRMVLLMQQSSERESLARLFNDDPVQMAKGYIPEIYNPHTDLKAATKDEGEILENLGYKKVSDLGLDPHDVYREGHALYVMRDGGLRPWLSGMFSFTNMRAKGTKHHGERAVGTQNGLDRARQRAINDMALPGAGQNFDPTQVKENYMVPVLNPMGKAVNHQYLMQASTKDRLLERDSRFDTVLGALAGSVFDKDNSPKHNRKVVEVLHADFEKEFAKDAKAFRTVGPSSPDPELREIYAMLPQSTKDAIKDVWGSDSMLVHVGNLDIAFGYRKLSMSTMFSKDAAERDAIDKAAVFLLENILKHYAKVFLHYDDAEAEKYSKRTAVTVQRAENIWQAVVHEVKDIYVIKNIITSLNNIRSNMLTLFLYGVTPMNGLRDMRIAWVGAEEHHRDSEQLFKLQNLLSTGYVTGDTSHIQSEIDRLNIAIKNNPVTEMINAGLMPTIVEDVANEDDPYSYKSAFIKSTEKYTSKLNSSVRSAGKVAYMSHDTKVYQSLARITQLSDFVARYALYQQLTTRKENPVSKEVAIQEASDAFINYDVPMNRNLQYMDDMGFFMFTKYFLRIQRVIRGRFIHSSGKMALMLGAESYLGSMPTIMDASVLVRAGNNPLGMGALQFPSAIGEIAPIAATRAMAHGLFNM